MSRICARYMCIYLALACLTASGQADAQTNPPTQPKRQREGTSDASRFRERQGPISDEKANRPARFPFEFRTIDGTGNNKINPDWGSADIELLRLTTVAYDDGTGTPSGADRPGARAVSNICAAQDGFIPNARGLSDFFWQWGQFLDHDIDLTPIADPQEPFDIPVPRGDTWFDPNNTGQMSILLDRSFYVEVDGVRQQVNEITAFIDGSNVYGSDETRAQALRTLDGTGRLKTSEGNLLPFNTDMLPNAPKEGPVFFLAGDFRANEQVALTAMHTLFVREHNFWADLLRRIFRRADGDVIYEWARAIVTAELQAITYNEFLPLLLGEDGLPSYQGYDPNVNPGISNVFATAAYRFGHTMLSPQLLRLDRFNQPIPAGPLSLADAFFNPQELMDTGIEPFLRGLARQRAQEVDNRIVDGVRNFLFGPPGPAGFDLASLNIQRGRDHGLPSYNKVREDFGLPPRTSFAEINSDPQVGTTLASIYPSLDQIDPWIGGLAEDKVEGAMVGETFHTVLKDQFSALRDGDRFWYEAYFPRWLVRLVDRQKLDSIIRRNTSIGFEMRGNVFLAP